MGLKLESFLISEEISMHFINWLSHPVDHAQVESELYHHNNYTVEVRFKDIHNLLKRKHVSTP